MTPLFAGCLADLVNRPPVGQPIGLLATRYVAVSVILPAEGGSGYQGWDLSLVLNFSAALLLL
ncbi:MAG: hypothetical protein OWV35_13145 [Firmicutes bacterium]|nr:hypothetical protein [Bacillota bacterium]